MEYKTLQAYNSNHVICQVISVELREEKYVLVACQEGD